MEYIEEFPPLMGFVGMSSKIKNYYKRKPENDKGLYIFLLSFLPYTILLSFSLKVLKGDLTYAHTSPFLALSPFNPSHSLSRTFSLPLSSVSAKQTTERTHTPSHTY